MIDFITEEIEKVSIEEDSIITWIDDVVEAEVKIVGDLCFIFCSDEYLLNINKQYLQHNYFTDVITFDYSEANIISGDIFISIDSVNSNSLDYKISFNEELLRVIIHGILHLLGYGDKTDEEKIIMTSREDECLNLYRDVK